MKVYVVRVIEDWSGETHIIGVYETEEKALAAISEFCEDDDIDEDDETDIDYEVFTLQ